MDWLPFRNPHSLATLSDFTIRKIPFFSSSHLIIEGFDSLLLSISFKNSHSLPFFLLSETKIVNVKLLLHRNPCLVFHAESNNQFKHKPKLNFLIHVYCLVPCNMCEKTNSLLRFAFVSLDLHLVVGVSLDSYEQVEEVGEAA